MPSYQTPVSAVPPPPTNSHTSMHKQTNKHMSAYGGSSENFSFFSNLLLGAATARSRLRSLYSLCVRGSGSTVKCKRCVAQRQYLSNDYYALRPPTSQKRILNHQEENTALPPTSSSAKKKNAMSRNAPSPHATCTAASKQTQTQTQNARWLVVLSIYPCSSRRSLTSAYHIKTRRVSPHQCSPEKHSTAQQTPPKEGRKANNYAHPSPPPPPNRAPLVFLVFLDRGKKKPKILTFVLRLGMSCLGFEPRHKSLGN